MAECLSCPSMTAVAWVLVWSLYSSQTIAWTTNPDIIAIGGNKTALHPLSTTMIFPISPRRNPFRLGSGASVSSDPRPNTTNVTNGNRQDYGNVTVSPSRPAKPQTAMWEHFGFQIPTSDVTTSDSFANTNARHANETETNSQPFAIATVFLQRTGSNPTPAKQSISTMLAAMVPRHLADTLRDAHNHLPNRSTDPRIVLACTTLICIAMILMVPCHMMADGGGNRGGEFNHRRPPAWGPEMEREYSFRAYITDLMHWVLLTDLQPHQQAAAILMRLTGAARELTRTMTGDEILQGAVVDGVHRDPVSYVILGLRQRFGQLDEEMRLAAMTEMLAFQRRRNETINQVLSRYEVVRSRARDEGNFVMSVEGSALQLLRACHVSSSQMVTLLQPFNNQLPNTEAQFRALQEHMRRIGHILEHAPNNVAQSLAGNREANRGAYHAMQQSALATPTLQTYFQSPGFGDDMAWPDAQPDTAWESWQPSNYAEAYPVYQPPAYMHPDMPHDGSIDEQLYLAEDVWEGDSFDSGTNSDTSSDDGTEAINMDDLQGLSVQDASVKAFLQYRHARRKWRRFTNKRVRKVRRRFKKTHYHFARGKGKGKFRKGGKKSGGRGAKRGFAFLTQENVLAYLKGTGKSKHAKTSGQGFGRKGNPKDRNGVTMKCHECGSTDHLRRECPVAGGNSGSAPTFHATQQAFSSMDYAAAASSAAGTAINAPDFLYNAPQLAVQQRNDTGGPLDELLGATNVTHPVNAAGFHMVSQDQDNLWGDGDPWQGQSLPQSSRPSSVHGQWDNYNSTSAAPRPAAASREPSVDAQDELASSRSGSTPAPASTAFAGMTSAAPPAVPVMQNFLGPEQLQEILVRGRSARINLARAANLPDGQRTYEQGEQRARTMQGGSIFGRQAAQQPMGSPRSQYASAKALARIPTIFGGQAGTTRSAPVAMSTQESELLAVSSALGQAPTQATSQPTTGLLFGEGPGPAAGLAQSLAPGTLFTAPMQTDIGSMPNVGPVLTRETHAPTTGSTVQAGSIEFISRFNSQRRERSATAPGPTTVNPQVNTTGVESISTHTPVFERSPADIPVPDNADDAQLQTTTSFAFVGQQIDVMQWTEAQHELVYAAEHRPRTHSGDVIWSQPGTPVPGTPPAPVEIGTPRSSSDSSMPGLVNVSAPPSPVGQTPVPDIVTFDGEDTQCTICLGEFMHSERVCRLQCGHVFHGNCWNTACRQRGEVYRQQRQDNPADTSPFIVPCPNCRGNGRTIAIWNWIDHARITQFINGVDGEQVHNQYDPDVPLEQQLPAPGIGYELATPRSVTTDYVYESPFSTPRTQPRVVSPRLQDELSYVVLPSTFADYNEWISTNVGDALGSSNPQPQRSRYDGCVTHAFHTETRLSDGRPAVIIDPGSVGNLGGDQWARSVGVLALASGRKVAQSRRDRPLNVAGVGNGSQKCTHNCTLPIAMRRLDGKHAKGTFTLPIVDKSELPGLLGLNTMRERNAVLDLKNLHLHFCGPGDFDLTAMLPPGTESFQGELAPSGHMVIPVCEYKGVDQEERGSLDVGGDLALLARHSH